MADRQHARVDPISFGPCGQCVRTDKHSHIFPLVGEFKQCEHGYHHPPWPHSCDGCFCDDERDIENNGGTV